MTLQVVHRLICYPDMLLLGLSTGIERENAVVHEACDIFDCWIYDPVCISTFLECLYTFLQIRELRELLQPNRFNSTVRFILLHGIVQLPTDCFRYLLPTSPSDVAWPYGSINVADVAGTLVSIPVFRTPFSCESSL